ncbi:TM1812 family CRISPR-associated protein [Sulfolobus acidocaldarius]|nr:TM1812 family CRISPR-associated protein [Sulfolobus acidocaldarius]
MSKKLVIASWGDPSAWKSVTYIDGEDSSQNPRKIASISSLRLLAEKFSDIQKFYVLVQDSIVFTTLKRINDECKECGQKINAYITAERGEAVWLNEPISTYEELVKKVKDYTSCILDRLGIRNHEVFILPSNLRTSINVQPSPHFTSF